MAIQRDTRYPGRFDAADAEYPQGKFKNRSTPTARDGSYFERDWINDIIAPLSAAMVKTNQTANGNVDTAEASQYFDALERMRVTQPINNTLNGFFRRSQSAVDSPAGFPDPGGTVYAADAEFTRGWFSGAANNNIGITDVNGITFTQPIYIETELDPANDLTVDDIYIHIIGQDNLPHWFKNGDAGGNVTVAITGNTLRVTLGAAILDPSRFTSIKSAFVQDEPGLIPELNNDAVLLQSLELLRSVFVSLAGDNTLEGNLVISNNNPTLELDAASGNTSVRLTENSGEAGFVILNDTPNNTLRLQRLSGGVTTDLMSVSRDGDRPFVFLRDVRVLTTPPNSNSATSRDYVNSQTFGTGQAWSTPNRSLSTNYTNSTGRTIWVSIIIQASSDGVSEAQLLVDGSVVASFRSNEESTFSIRRTLYAPIPAGAVYRVNRVSGTSVAINRWSELR